MWPGTVSSILSLNLPPKPVKYSYNTNTHTTVVSGHVESHHTPHLEWWYCSSIGCIASLTLLHEAAKILRTHQPQMKSSYIRPWGSDVMLDLVCHEILVAQFYGHTYGAGRFTTHLLLLWRWFWRDSYRMGEHGLVLFPYLWQFPALSSFFSSPSLSLAVSFCETRTLYERKHITFLTILTSILAFLPHTSSSSASFSTGSWTCLLGRNSQWSLSHRHLLFLLAPSLYATTLDRPHLPGNTHAHSLSVKCELCAR